MPVGWCSDFEFYSLDQKTKYEFLMISACGQKRWHIRASLPWGTARLNYDIDRKNNETTNIFSQISHFVQYQNAREHNSIHSEESFYHIWIAHKLTLSSWYNLTIDRADKSREQQQKTVVFDVFAIFCLAEKSLSNINRLIACLLMSPQGQENIDVRLSEKDISSRFTMRGTRVLTTLCRIIERNRHREFIWINSIPVFRIIDYLWCVYEFPFSLCRVYGS